MYCTAPYRNCCDVGGAMLESYRENFVALGGESCSSNREPASDSCI
jgi:hypothetical protein